MPGTGRQKGGWGLCRPCLSCSTTRLPPVRCPQAAPASGTLSRQRVTSRREAACPLSGAGTSLVRALALHGVAMLRSHLASPLRPGRGVLIRSVSRRLGSAAYVREDASPNEVSSLINQRMPAALPECQTGPALPPDAQPWRDHSQHGPVRYLLKHAPRPGRYRRTRPAPRHRRLREQFGLMISCCQASNQLCISPCPTTCPVTEEPQCPPHQVPQRSPTQHGPGRCRQPPGLLQPDPQPGRLSAPATSGSPCPTPRWACSWRPSTRPSC